MARARKPAVYTGGANYYAASGERIVEITDNNGARLGALMAVRSVEDGERLHIELYRMDKGVSVAVEGHEVSPKHTPAEAEGAVPCAYCRKSTPPELQATRPWTWPGRGLVTNCKSCAGMARCAAGHEWDAAEWGPTVPEYCPMHEDEREELRTHARRLREATEAYLSVCRELESWWEENPSREPHPDLYRVRDDNGVAVAELVPDLLRLLRRTGLA